MSPSVNCDIFVSAAIIISAGLLSFLLFNKKALEILFYNFAAREHVWLPRLKRIYLLLMHEKPDVAHQEECTELATKAEKAGVILRLEKDE